MGEGGGGGMHGGCREEGCKAATVHISWTTAVPWWRCVALPCSFKRGEIIKIRRNRTRKDTPSPCALLDWVQGGVFQANHHISHARWREVQRLFRRVPCVPREIPRLVTCPARAHAPALSPARAAGAQRTRSHPAPIGLPRPPSPAHAPRLTHPSGAPQVPGRVFPVEIIHSMESHSQDYLQAAVDTAMDIHCNQGEGAGRGRGARSVCVGQEG